MKYLIFIMSLLFSNSSGFGQDMPDESHISYRPPTAAGTFYPDNPDSLRSMINAMLSDANNEDENENDIIAMVVPHAGYVFSGGVAARAYKLLKGRHYDAIIIIGPSHFKSFEGASIFDGDGYTTPLGNAIIDKDLVREIAKNNELIRISRTGHNWNENRSEHSIEVQIPFLQIVQPEVPIVPILVGGHDFRTVDALLKTLTTAIENSKKKVLLIASSDLSHYHSRDMALALDSSVAKAFNRYDYFQLESQLFSHRWEACGAGAIISIMIASERLGGTEPEVIEYSTSADSKYVHTNSDKVVGYMSAVINKSSKSLKLLPELDEKDKQLLLSEARQAIENITLKKDNINKKNVTGELAEHYAAFVTIRKDDSLRACMGHTHATASLFDEVIESAKIAATKDFRFGAIRPDELNDLNIEITVLSRMKRILNNDEIEVGRDGLYIRYNGSAGLLLPQVATERNWDRETFLKALCEKAGLPINTYKNPDAEIFIFHAIILK